MKRLVIINGVTGAIGSASLAKFSRDSRNTIIGISRKAKSFHNFLRDGFMPDATLACSIGEDIVSGMEPFVETIDFSQYEEVVYIHCVGSYAFEINEAGGIEVKNDNDGDGINDQTKRLSYDAFFAAVEPLAVRARRLKAIIFGGLADKAEPAVHQSWWKTMKQVRAKAEEMCKSNEHLSMTILSISSVMCPNELITRPFVFTNTDAKGNFWLMPHEVAQEVEKLSCGEEVGLFERELFHPAEYYRQGYFDDKPFTTRKSLELGVSVSPHSHL